MAVAVECTGESVLVARNHTVVFSAAVADRFKVGDCCRVQIAHQFVPARVALGQRKPCALPFSGAECLDGLQLLDAADIEPAVAVGIAYKLAGVLWRSVEGIGESVAIAVSCFEPADGQPAVSAGWPADGAGAAMLASAAAATEVLACAVRLAAAGAPGAGAVPVCPPRPVCAAKYAATSSICCRLSVRIAPPMIESARVPA